MNAVSRLLRFFGLACLAMVVLTHIAEKLHVLPNMGWACLIALDTTLIL